MWSAACTMHAPCVCLSTILKCMSQPCSSLVLAWPHLPCMCINNSVTAGIPCLGLHFDLHGRNPDPGTPFFSMAGPINLQSLRTERGPFISERAAAAVQEGSGCASPPDVNQPLSNAQRLQVDGDIHGTEHCAGFRITRQASHLVRQDMVSLW